jgi:hypothetical protein
MKKVVYRLQFRFEESNDKNENRNDKLNAILSSIEDIDSEEQINAPVNGSIIEIDGIDYKVSNKKYTFITEGDLVYYTTVVELSNEKIKKEKEKSEHDILLEKMRRMIGDSRYDKWCGSQDYYKFSKLR